MIKPLNILFLLADAGHARLVSLSRETGDYRTLVERRRERSHERGGLGVVFQSFGEGRHTTGPRSSASDRHRGIFLDRVVAEAAALASEGGFAGMALVAPARILPALRERVPASVEVVGELAKDLTKIRDHDLAAWLRSVSPAGAG